MADKRIDELVEATSITTTDLFVLEQANTAKKLTGQTMITFLTALANAHGGIAGITKTSSSGTNPVVDTYTITFADTSTWSYNVTNGLKGDTGATGAQGPKGDNITITLAEVKYQQGASGTTPPTGSWLSSPPAVSQGAFLWTRTIINYSDGTGVTSYSVARMGVDGTGSVSSVNGVSPDGNGNVALTPANIGALPDTYTAPVSSVNGNTGTVVITASGLGAAELSGTKVKPSQASSAIESKTASFTLALADAGKMMLVNTGTDITVTIPLNSSVAFDIGTEIEITRLGAGEVAIAGATGVTIDSILSMTSVSDQYGVVALKKLDTNEWLLAGALK